MGGYAICLTIIQNVTAADVDRIWLVVLCEELASTWLKLHCKESILSADSEGMPNRFWKVSVL